MASTVTHREQQQITIRSKKFARSDTGSIWKMRFRRSSRNSASNSLAAVDIRSFGGSGSVTCETGEAVWVDKVSLAAPLLALRRKARNSEYWSRKWTSMRENYSQNFLAPLSDSEYFPARLLKQSGLNQIRFRPMRPVVHHREATARQWQNHLLRGEVEVLTYLLDGLRYRGLTIGRSLQNWQHQGLIIRYFRQLSRPPRSGSL